MAKEKKAWQTRRALFSNLAMLAAAGSWSGASASSYPNRSLRLIVPGAAGGAPDLLCRVMGSALASALGQAVVIDNRPGAGGIAGTLEMVRAAPDGYTLGYANVGTLAINRALYGQLPYDPDRQLAPVAMTGFVQNALVVRNELPILTVGHLISYLKKNPRKVTMASAGNGTTSHLSGELFKSMTGTSMLHVPYRGSSAAIQDLIGGRVDVMFDNLSSICPFIESDRVRGLAVTGARRSPLLPHLPTVREAGVSGYESVAWGGIVVPAGTRTDIINVLNGEFTAMMSNAGVRESLTRLSLEPASGPTDVLFELAKRETPVWASLVRRANVQID
ncbi:Bug family tripartite tricarboxylate transporter substrate binding protein [Ottowia thiooxydans]|uniref:Bug family tripartite tricarboxylate transporter substrate binding protein n=1 Tax=Ottowia thiooxydans TaxID=219182 RepID=UPI003399AF69